MLSKSKCMRLLRIVLDGIHVHFFSLKEIKIVSSAPFLTRLQDIIIFVILLSLCSYPRGEYKATACKTRFPCCSFEYDSTCHYAPYFNSGTNTSSAKRVLCYQFKYVATHQNNHRRSHKRQCWYCYCPAAAVCCSGSSKPSRSTG
ncbi:hypothetical protein ACS0TY_015657 [Phlomoides rotata]